MTYEAGTVIPWGFSQRKFADFVDEFERLTKWKYSGETDLILIEPNLDFADTVVYDVEAMQRDGAISNAASLQFEGTRQRAGFAA